MNPNRLRTPDQCQAAACAVFEARLVVARHVTAPYLELELWRLEKSYWERSAALSAKPKPKPAKKARQGGGRG